MKRTVLILTAVCLLCGALSAAAEDPLRVIGLGFTMQEVFEAQHPDMPLTVLELSYTPDGVSNMRALLLGGDWDAATIYMGQPSITAITLRELYDLGLAADLSGNEAIAAKAASLYPAVRDAVTVNGHLAGVPLSATRKVMQLSLYTPRGQTQSTFAKLGFTEADVPHTFSELCDLAVAYMALPREARMGTVFDVDCVSASSYRYFLYYLIELYTAEYSDLGGHVAYNTPAFREALADLQRMAAALDEDPKVLYAGDGSLTPVICDASQMLGGSTETMLDLNLYIEHSGDIPARMGVLIVNPGSPRLGAALRFAQIQLADLSAQFEPLLYTDRDYAALARRAFEQDLAMARYFRDEYAGTLEKTYGETPEAYYLYSPEELADYRQNVAPCLTFRPIPLINADTAAGTYLKSNQLDVEGLIRYLNESAAQPQE